MDRGTVRQPKGIPILLTTGQILKGLIAIHPILQEVSPALLKGCDWLETRVGPTGAISTPTADALQLADGSHVPDAFHLYTLEPLKSCLPPSCLRSPNMAGRWPAP